MLGRRNPSLLLHALDHVRNLGTAALEFLVLRIQLGFFRQGLFVQALPFRRLLLHQLLLGRYLGVGGVQVPLVGLQGSLLGLQGFLLGFQPGNQGKVPVDYPLEQEHPGRKIPEIRGPQQHIQVIHLTVFINIPQTLFVDFPGPVVILLLGVERRLVLPDLDFQVTLPALHLRQFPFGRCQLVLGSNQPVHRRFDFRLLVFPLGVLFFHLLLHVLQLRFLVLNGFRLGHRCRKLQRNKECRQERCSRFPFLHAPAPLIRPGTCAGKCCCRRPQSGCPPQSARRTDSTYTASWAA